MLCGGRTERDPESPTTVTNPKVLVEVTSDSTEDYDRGAKLKNYQAIPSVMAVVIVSHRERLVEVWTRTEGQGEGEWVHTEGRDGAVVEVLPVRAKLNVDSLYAAAEEPVGTGVCAVRDLVDNGFVRPHFAAGPPITINPPVSRVDSRRATSDHSVRIFCATLSLSAYTAAMMGKFRKCARLF